MKVLITGGAGFIGSYLTEFLFNNGHQVFIIDKLSAQVHGKRVEESYLYKKVLGKAVIFKEDLLASNSMESLIEECDYIIHLAAETGTGQSMYEIGEYVKSNSLGTALILEKLLKSKNKVRKLVLASSRAVYGEGRYHCAEHGIVYPETRISKHLDSGDFYCKCPVCGISVEVLPTSEDSKINPLSIYGITKYNQEQLVSTICAAIQVPYTIFRFQNVYGKGQSLSNPYTGILAIFSKLILENKEINIFEDGYESRDFIHVEDIITAINLDLYSTSKNQVYNVGTSLKTSVSEIINILSQVLNTSIKSKVTGSYRIGDIRHNFADISKISKELKFHPKVSLKDGIQDLLQWVNIQHNNMRGDKDFFESLQEMERLDLFVKKT